MALPPYPPPPPNLELERLKGWVGQYFPIYDTRITPNSLVLLVHADPATLELKFDRLRQELWTKFYVPQIRYERGEYVLEIVRRPAVSPYGPLVNVILLALTGLTTLTAGAIFWLAYRGGTNFTLGDFVNGGLYFALPLLAILGLHELAHYVVARRHHVEASLPFFLPLPPPYFLFGTFGAFISLREPIPTKKALLDVGASGPLAGFAVAIPVTLAGFYLSSHSHALSVANCGPVVLGMPFGNLVIGPSVIWSLLGYLVPGSFQNLQPLALAGWVGLLVTAMNLLPAGQLDGGHVFRALFGPASTYVSVLAVILLFGIGFLFGYFGWIIFAFLIFLLGIRHPPPLNDITPLDLRRRGIGAAALVILVGGFVVVPLAPATGSFAYVSDSFHHLPGNYTGMADSINVTVQNQGGEPFGFVLSGSIRSIVAHGNNSSTIPLSGSAAAAFNNSSVWTVLSPNGNTSTFNGSGSFALSSGEYSRVGDGQTVTYVVTFRNPEQATVEVQFSASLLCVGGTATGPSPVLTIY